MAVNDDDLRVADGQSRMVVGALHFDGLVRTVNAIDLLLDEGKVVEYEACRLAMSACKSFLGDDRRGRQ